MSVGQRPKPFLPRATAAWRPSRAPPAPEVVIGGVPRRLDLGPDQPEQRGGALGPCDHFVPPRRGFGAIRLEGGDLGAEARLLGLRRRRRASAPAAAVPPPRGSGRAPRRSPRSPRPLRLGAPRPPSPRPPRRRAGPRPRQAEPPLGEPRLGVRCAAAGASGARGPRRAPPRPRRARRRRGGPLGHFGLAGGEVPRPGPPRRPAARTCLGRLRGPLGRGLGFRPAGVRPRRGHDPRFGLGLSGRRPFRKVRSADPWVSSSAIDRVAPLLRRHPLLVERGDSGLERRRQRRPARSSENSASICPAEEIAWRSSSARCSRSVPLGVAFGRLAPQRLRAGPRAPRLPPPRRCGAASSRASVSRLTITTGTRRPVPPPRRPRGEPRWRERARRVFLRGGGSGERADQDRARRADARPGTAKPG